MEGKGEYYNNLIRIEFNNNLNSNLELTSITSYPITDKTLNKIVILVITVSWLFTHVMKSPSCGEGSFSSIGPLLFYLNLKRLLLNSSLEQNHETTEETRHILINLDIRRRSKANRNIYCKINIFILGYRKTAGNVSFSV